MTGVEGGGGGGVEWRRQSGISQEQVLILLYGFWRPSILVEVERPRSIECRILHSC